MLLHVLCSFLCGSFPNTLHIKDRMGRTALHYAAICNDGGQYYDLLRQFGADASITDSVSSETVWRRTAVNSH